MTPRNPCPVKFTVCLVNAGLGLALTRKLVEMHGGCIWVESEAGKGSKFTFLIPIQTENPEAAEGIAPASNIIDLKSAETSACEPDVFPYPAASRQAGEK